MEVGIRPGFQRHVAGHTAGHAGGHEEAHRPGPGGKAKGKAKKQSPAPPPPEAGRDAAPAPVFKLAGAPGVAGGPGAGLGAGQEAGAGKRWSLAKLRATDAIIPLQSGTNQYASQTGMTGFGTPRNTATKVTTTNPSLETEVPAEAESEARVGRWSVRQLRASNAIIPLQYGTNQFASQRGMTGFGCPRDVTGKHLHRLWEIEYPEAVGGGDLN